MIENLFGDFTAQGVEHLQNVEQANRERNELIGAQKRVQRYQQEAQSDGPGEEVSKLKDKTAAFFKKPAKGVLENELARDAYAVLDPAPSPQELIGQIGADAIADELSANTEMINQLEHAGLALARGACVAVDAELTNQIDELIRQIYALYEQRICVAAVLTAFTDFNDPAEKKRAGFVQNPISKDLDKHMKALSAVYEGSVRLGLPRKPAQVIQASRDEIESAVALWEGYGVQRITALPSPNAMGARV